MTIHGTNKGQASHMNEGEELKDMNAEEVVRRTITGTALGRRRNVLAGTSFDVPNTP